jgi:DNA-binding MarR family transcriptional regulator
MSQNTDHRERERFQQIAKVDFGFNTRRAARAVAQVFDRELSRHGIKSTQFTLLGAIESLGPISLNELATALVIDRTALSRNMRPLERNGWIVRVPHRDRRRRQFDLTGSGRKLLHDAVASWQTAQSGLEQKVGDATSRYLEALGHIAVVAQT